MVTKLVTALPGVRRLRGALHDINHTLGQVGSAQGELREEVEAQLAETRAKLLELSDEVQRLTENVSRTAPAQHATGAAVPDEAALSPNGASPDRASDTTLSDRQISREFQRAALRNLPFIMGDYKVAPNYVTFEGFAGAAEDLTENMGFFINGRRCNHEEYPRPAPDFDGRFTEVRGSAYAVRARLRADTLALADERGFLRFDASPTGVYVPGAWRKAMHVMHPARERFPVPSAANLMRVVGEAHEGRFLNGGATLFRNIETLLAELGKSWRDVPRILDWGSGAGRLTRYLIQHSGSAVTGVDIDPDNVAWCRENLAGGTFEQIPLLPPTRFPDASFDLIIGVSVMTHLKREVHDAWLAELQRLLAPGGIILLSVQGPTQYAYNSFSPRVYREAEEHGFVDFTPDGALDEVLEDKDYYRGAVQSRWFIAEEWGRYFEVLAIEDAIAALQDFVVMRRRTDEAQREWEGARRRRLMTEARLTGSRALAEGDDDGSAAYWSVAPEDQAEAVGWYWMAHPMVQARINTLVSGRPDQDAYGRFAQIWTERGNSLPIGRALSIGCGFGGLERDLCARGMVGRIDAFDPAPGAITEARRLAAEAGFNDIHYQVGDLESLDYPAESFDVVFAHQSVHHVERLEELFAKVKRLLKPGGLFHLHEYVGPNRFQWTEEQMEYVNELLDSLPRRLRRTPTGQKPAQERATVETMIAVDPTEAVRSADILPLLRQHFTVVEERPFGGTLVHLALGNIAQNFRTDSAEDVARMQAFFALEDRLMREGVIGSDFVVVTAARN
ncbi:class I SAM-dependent methyltransferase [Roseomonas elaeocarpi]|uniref:Methyltransferase domain-containing protein n=1 Tax=Roseomonas elaeocarpi TaxID=907779 RepID=A0ABV6JSD4_9PROT